MKKPKLEDVDLDKFSETMHSESDRACARLGAAILDAKLEDLFTKRLRTFQKELTSGTGPISTFSSRIKLANALSWISDPVRKDLDTIRDIRNEFAHNFDHELSFENESISARCKNLTVTQAYLEGYEDAKKRPGQNLSPHVIDEIRRMFEAPRWRFQLASHFIVQYIDDLSASTSTYEGPNLLDEVRNLSADFRVKVSASVTVEPASKS